MAGNRMAGNRMVGVGVVCRVGAGEIRRIGNAGMPRAHARSPRGAMAFRSRRKQVLVVVWICLAGALCYAYCELRCL